MLVVPYSSKLVIHEGGAQSDRLIIDRRDLRPNQSACHDTVAETKISDVLANLSVASKLETIRGFDSCD